MTDVNFPQRTFLNLHAPKTTGLQYIQGKSRYENKNLYTYKYNEDLTLCSQ